MGKNNMTKLEDIKTEWRKFIVLKDDRAVDMMLATVIGNMLIDLDPIWLMMVAPSSGGKTTLLAPIVDIRNVYFVDDLTEKTLLSGYKVKGKNSSLLQLIGSGIMAFSDFTSILSKNPVSRGEILSQLKLVYDRKVSKYTGTGGVKWEGKIGFLGAATADIYYHLESGRSMGERFIYYWLDVPTDEEISKKQQETTISAKDMTDVMKAHYADYFNSVEDWVEKNGVPGLKMTPEQRERVRQASMFCVAGKATVHTNFKSGKVDQIPQKASVGRDNKSFESLLMTFQVMYCYETGNPEASVQEWMIDIVEKCAYSSINRERRAILEILADTPKPITATQIGSTRGLGLEKDGVSIYLAPLFAVGLIRRQVTGNTHKWFMEEGPTKTFVNKVANSVPQIKLKEHEDVIEEENDPIWDSM
jgi:DNA-binding transcriptional ArsR family regulator